jgi:hypothetical protein
MSRIAQVAYPSVEPVTVGEVKNYVRVFVSSDDTLIGDFITAGREWIEDETGLCLASRSFILFEDNFPYVPFDLVGYNSSPSAMYFGFGNTAPSALGGWNPRTNPFQILLRRNPVTAVDHIEYVDISGNIQTLTPGADFMVDLVSTPARIAPLPSGRWPTAMSGLNNVRIYLTAGGTQATAGTIGTSTETVTDPGAPTPPDQDTNSFTITTDIPRPLKIGIFQLVLHWYENRGAVTAGTANSIPRSLDNLVKSYRLLNIEPAVTQ